MSDPLDLPAYLTRVGFEGTPRADLDTLRELHRLHPIAIPFENLSTLVGAPVALDLASVQDKLVRARRGGYCFEHNALFAAGLRALGFELVTLAARVVWHRDEAEVGGRTHMLMLVNLDSQEYLCDVGFGGLTLNVPVPFVPDRKHSGPQERFRVAACGQAEYELAVELNGEWRPMYRFDRQVQSAADYDILNYYVATHGDSIFRSRLMAARRTVEGRLALANARYRRYSGQNVAEEREFDTVDALRTVLERQFEISLPSGADLDAALERVLETPSGP